jgi:hypothetical protein
MCELCSEFTSEGKRITKLEQILLNSAHICIVRSFREFVCALIFCLIFEFDLCFFFLFLQLVPGGQPQE